MEILIPIRRIVFDIVLNKQKESVFNRIFVPSRNEFRHQRPFPAILNV